MLLAEKFARLAPDSDLAFHGLIFRPDGLDRARVCAVRLCLWEEKPGPSVKIVGTGHPQDSLRLQWLRRETHPVLGDR